MDLDQAIAFARDELVRLVQIRSFSGEEHEIVAYLEARSRDLSLPVRRQRVEGAADNLLIGWSRRPALLLNAHVDTIRPAWDWSGQAVRIGDDVAGLGALDDKAGVVACLLALLLAREAGVPLERLPIGVGLTVDEEVGGKGSLVMAQALSPGHVVVVEGTDLDLGLIEAGTVEVWVRLRGRAVHGAIREEGDNAAEHAVRMVGEILDLPATTRSHPLLGRNAPMLWEIRSGQALNVVPDLAEVHVDVRVVPGTSATEVLEALRQVCRPYGGRVDVVEVVEPFETPRDDPVARALAQAASRIVGSVPQPFAMPAWTDAHNFVDEGGSRAMLFGPSHLRHAHRPEERVGVHDVVRVARVFADLIAHPMWSTNDGRSRTGSASA